MRSNPTKGIAVKTKTKNDIFNQLKTDSSNWSSLYKSDALNYSGDTAPTDTDNGGECDTEVAAEWIYDHFAELSDGILQVERKWREGCQPEKPYSTISHLEIRRNESPSATDQNSEAYIEQLLYIAEKGLNWDIGTILDHQIPLSNLDDDSLGEIDLLSCRGNIMYILELKKADNKNDSLLHCIMQAYTYYKTIKDKSAFKKSFMPDSSNIQLALAPLFFEGSRPDEEIKRPHDKLAKLVERINSEVKVDFMRISKNGSDDASKWSIQQVKV